MIYQEYVSTDDLFREKHSNVDAHVTKPKNSRYELTTRVTKHGKNGDNTGLDLLVVMTVNDVMINETGQYLVNMIFCAEPDASCREYIQYLEYEDSSGDGSSSGGDVFSGSGDDSLMHLEGRVQLIVAALGI